MKTMAVRVTEHNIREGEPNDESECAVALALKRRFPNATFVSVEPPMVYIGDSRWRLTRADSRFVRRFDALENVRPRTVTLVKEDARV